MNMNHSPPLSLAELNTRMQALAGKTLGALASEWGEKVPTTLHHAKGWVGQLIEKALGANAAQLDLPDFIELGIELKTLPITSTGKVCESTYICMASLPPPDPDWEHSRVWRKMAKMLWVPIERDLAIPLPARRIGTPLLWSPSDDIEKQLRQDWEELTELMTLGHFEALSAHQGQFLQIRPKAANSKTLIQVMNQDGVMVSTVPKGFYLRAAFTQKIVEALYASPKI